MEGLFSTLVLDKLTLKNRIVMPPMKSSTASFFGEVTNEMIEYYIKHSNNLGLLIVEHSYISIEGKFSDKQLGIYEDNLITGLKKLTDRVHAKDTPIVLQINHAGAKASEDIIGIEPVAPSATIEAREIQIQEIDDIIGRFALAAERAIKAGFDGVEIHGAHGYLLNQFYSPLMNRRKDKYGGSFDNRIRLPLEVVKGVKERLEEGLLLYRMGSVDLDQNGIQIEDSEQFAIELEKNGVDILDISGGLCGHLPSELQGKQGFFIPQAEQIKKVVKIPVIGVGGITEPLFADNLIKSKKVDLVAIGRELIRDPDWPLKAIRTLAN